MDDMLHTNLGILCDVEGLKQCIDCINFNRACELPVLPVFTAGYIADRFLTGIRPQERVVVRSKTGSAR